MLVSTLIIKGSLCSEQWRTQRLIVTQVAKSKLKFQLRLKIFALPSLSLRGNCETVRP